MRFTAVLLLLACAAFAQDKFKKDRERYELGMRRPPLGKRAGAIGRFARTRDARAFDLLIKRYRKPKLPAEQEQYLIASALGKSFGSASFAAARRTTLERLARKEHAWLWYQLGRTAAARPESVRSSILRAALWEARSAVFNPADLRELAGVLGPEAKPHELVVRAGASLIYAHRERLGQEDFRVAALSVIAQLADKSLSDGTKLVIARQLAAVFRVERVTTSPRYWRQLLSYAEFGQDAGPTVAARPKFFGVEASGDRILFLIDLSDSMLEPLSFHEKMDAQRLAGAKEEDQIDWKKVRTRFDLAKLFLERYLRALPSEVSFSIVGFGSRAVAINKARKLQKAKRGSVSASLKSLRKISVWGKDKLHPHGQLRGATNIHGAFRIAYQLTNARAIKAPVFIEPAGWTKGCDTIFLLSDGRPTTDDFAANDEFKGGRVTVNSETGETKKTGAGTASYRGPYAGSSHLGDDVERMNLFRKAEIHTIAMGSADAALMRRLARLGLGRYQSIGSRARGGHLRYWRVFGPIAAGEPDKWSTPLAPEKKPFEWRKRFEKRSWLLCDGSRKDGTVNVGKAVGRKKNDAAFFVSRFAPDVAGKAKLRVGAEGGVRVWLNGKLVIDALAVAKYKRDAHSVDVDLRAGENLLMVKCCYEKGAKWRMHARIDGAPIREITER